MTYCTYNVICLFLSLDSINCLTDHVPVAALMISYLCTVVICLSSHLSFCTLILKNRFVAMATFLLIVIAFLSFTSVTQSQNPFCIWGRVGMNNAINGLYSYTNTYNNAPYYLLTHGSEASGCGVNGDYYLYYSSGNWRIGGSLGGAYSVFCTAASSSFPQCSSDWQVYTGTWDPDPNVFIQADECPQWNCAGISVTGSSFSSCNGVYDLLPNAPNAYKQPGQIRYIYYEPLFNHWVCHDMLEPTDCPTAFSVASPEGWEELQTGTTINKGDLGTIECLGMFKNNNLS